MRITEKGQRLLLAAFAALAAVAGLPGSAAAAGARPVILATTTSTQDSGLLDVLLPDFEARCGCRVKTVAVGSGQALALGRRGEADVLLVHSPADEERLMAEGFGANRRLVMHNDLVVLGPAADPARVRGRPSASQAFRAIAASGSLFLSRGDESGTHSREKELWKAAGVEPSGAWYQQTGLGMGETLNVASEKGGYLLADRGTFLARNRARPLGLEVLVEGEPLLRNVYSVIEVSPARWPTVNGAGARALADYLVSAPVQEVIGRFGVKETGAPLFVPDAGKDRFSLGR
jgi:tungstate transport system substrate-binding protein